MSGGDDRVRPLLAPWYRRAQTADGRLALEYAQRVVTLEGGAARRLLPALLPLLDGRRTRDDLAAELGEAAAPALDAALAALDRTGLLTDGPPLPEEAPRREAETAAALAAAAVRRLSPAEAWRAVKEARPALVGAGVAAGEIARLLRACGAAPRRVAWDDGDDGLAVVAPAPEELPRLPEWNRGALERGSPWLQVLPFDGRMAAVGPLYLPGETCCHECYRLRRAANCGYGEELRALEAEPAAFPTPAPLAALAAAVAAQLALRWLVLRDPAAPAVLHAVEQSDELELTRHHVLRVPRCPACSASAVVARPLPWHEEVA